VRLDWAWAGGAKNGTATGENVAAPHNKQSKWSSDHGFSYVPGKHWWYDTDNDNVSTMVIPPVFCSTMISLYNVRPFCNAHVILLSVEL